MTYDYSETCKLWLMAQLDCIAFKKNPPCGDNSKNESSEGSDDPSVDKNTTKEKRELINLSKSEWMRWKMLDQGSKIRGLNLEIWRTNEEQCGKERQVK